MSIRKRQSRFSAAAALAALTLVAAPLTFMNAASADVAAHQIDTQKKGSLTIHKCKSTGATRTPTGKEDKTAQCTPISGVKFTVQRLDLDLTKEASWTTLAGWNGDYTANKTAVDALLKTPAKEMSTADQTGIAAFTNLELGAYLVKEADVSKAKSGGNAVQLVAGAPFLVTVPMTDQETHDKWLYDLHVYPKNSALNSTKSVSDEKVTKGGTLSYTLTTGVESLPKGTVLKSYKVFDPLHPALEFTPSAENLTVTVKKSEKATAAEEVVKLTYDVDFKASMNDKNRLKVELTTEGLQKLSKLAEENVSAVVVTELKNVKVKQTPLEACEAAAKQLPQEKQAAALEACKKKGDRLHNWGYVLPNDQYSESSVPETYPEDPENPGNTTPPDPKDPNTPPSTTNDAPSYFGTIVLTKKGSDIDPNTKKARLLSGAQFQVSYCTPEDKPGEALKFGEEKAKIFSSDQNGIVTINGLQLNNFFNGSAVTAKATKFCVEEVKAPQGYELNPEPIVVELKSDGDKTIVELARDVINVPENAGFHLPLTGASALIFSTVAGLVLLTVGVVLVIYRRKSEEKA